MDHQFEASDPVGSDDVTVSLSVSILSVSEIVIPNNSNVKCLYLQYTSKVIIWNYNYVDNYWVVYMCTLYLLYTFLLINPRLHSNSSILMGDTINFQYDTILITAHANIDSIDY